MAIKPRKCGTDDEGRKRCKRNKLVIKKSKVDNPRGGKSTRINEGAEKVFDRIRDSKLSLEIIDATSDRGREFIRENNVDAVPTLVTVDDRKLEGSDEIIPEIEETLANMNDPGKIKELG